MVSVVGEAGLGKSRLLYEFKRRLEGDDGRCIEGTCFNYGSSISYLPFLDVVRAFCDVSDDDNDMAATRHIHGRLTGLGLELTAVAPYLQHMLSLRIDDAMFAALPANLVRQRTVEALQALVQAEARQAPMALILEDVHWIDEATEDVVGSLVDTMADVPILLVLAYRPEYLHAWSDRPHHGRIDLAALEQSGGTALVRAVLAKTYASRVSLLRSITQSARRWFRRCSEPTPFQRRSRS